MLITCPECSSEISDKASACPRCGFPFRPRRQSKRMRLPNGFGQISKLPNARLRKPYRAMVTVGKTAEGKPICKLLKPVSYFDTYNAAYDALVKYHQDPSKKTLHPMQEIYDDWLVKYKSLDRSEVRIKQFENAWKNLQNLHQTPIENINIHMLRVAIEEGPLTNQFKTIAKTLVGFLYDYAVECEYVTHNLTRDFKLSENITKAITSERSSHIEYTKEELNILWQNTDDQYVKDLLIQCYSGWRPGELTQIRKEDVDLVNWSFKGGLKTENGRNRIVPIHPAIREFVAEKYHSSTTDTLYGYSTATFRDHLQILITKYHLNPAHKAHDGRVTFVTLCKDYCVEEYAIKYLVGHSVRDLTERVYTKRSYDWLVSEIEKIKVVV